MAKNGVPSRVGPNLLATGDDEGVVAWRDSRSDESKTEHPDPDTVSRPAVRPPGKVPTSRIATAQNPARLQEKL